MRLDEERKPVEHGLDSALGMLLIRITVRDTDHALKRAMEKDGEH